MVPIPTTLTEAAYSMRTYVRLLEGLHGVKIHMQITQ